MLKGVVFDCDGVLFDSLEANIAYYNAVLVQLGSQPMDAELEALAHRLSTRQLFDRVFSEDEPRREDAWRVAMNTDYGPYYAMMKPAEGLREVLGELQAHYRLAMATNRGMTAHGVVQRFNLSPPIELTVGILDVERPKPHPDMLLRCLEHFAIAPVEAVYVGDAITDLQAADAAGMRFVAMGQVPGAQWRVKALSELVALLRDWD